MNEIIRFKRWVAKISPRRGLICHFYLKDKETRYYGKADFAYFNLFSTSKDWIVKGTKGHGISYNNKTSQIPCLNCFEVNDKFCESLKDLGQSGNSMFEIGLVFNKRKLKHDFKNVIDVSTEWPDLYPTQNKCHYYDKARFRVGTLKPFNFCDVVRIETKRNKQCNDVDGIDVIRGDTVLAMLVKLQEQSYIDKLLRFKGLDQVVTFAVL